VSTNLVKYLNIIFHENPVIRLRTDRHGEANRCSFTNTGHVCSLLKHTGLVIYENPIKRRKALYPFSELENDDLMLLYKVTVQQSDINEN
jgi:hypothetical protein